MPSKGTSHRTIRRRLDDILSSIDEIQSFIADLSFEYFTADRRTYHAVVRCLEIISEASRHLPSAFKLQHSEIAWRRVADAGNVYRHVYDAVTPRRIWDTATIHLPILRGLIEPEIKKLSS